MMIETAPQPMSPHSPQIKRDRRSRGEFALHRTALPDEWQAAHFPIQREDCAGSGQNGAAGGLQCEADESGAAEHYVRVSLWCNPNNAAAAAVRSGNI